VGGSRDFSLGDFSVGFDLNGYFPNDSSGQSQINVVFRNVAYDMENTVQNGAG